MDPLTVKVIQDLAGAMTSASEIMDKQADRIRFLEERGGPPVAAAQ